MLRDVHTRFRLSPELLAVADRQHGLLSARQLEAAGASSNVRARLVADGPSSISAAGSTSYGPMSAQRRCLPCTSVVKALRSADGMHSISSASLSPARRSTGPSSYGCRRDNPCARARGSSSAATGAARLDRMSAHRILDPHDTVLDLCDDMPEQQALEFLLDAAREGVVQPERMAELLDARARHRHRAFLEAVLADASSGSDSILEFQYGRDVERPHGLPTPQRQIQVGSGPVDIWYEEFRCVIQPDGWRFHRHRVQADARTDAERAALGVVTLRFGWADVMHNPCSTARSVAAVLQRNGWLGSLTPCPRCS